LLKPKLLPIIAAGFDHAYFFVPLDLIAYFAAHFPGQGFWLVIYVFANLFDAFFDTFFSASLNRSVVVFSANSLPMLPVTVRQKPHSEASTLAIIGALINSKQMIGRYAALYGNNTKAKTNWPVYSSRLSVTSNL
jgi:hypothetical protein